MPEPINEISQSLYFSYTPQVIGCSKIPIAPNYIKVSMGSGLELSVLRCYIKFMARPLRIQYPGAFYHITARGNDKKKIFFNDDDSSGFLTILCKVIDRYHFILHSYCLMSNHYHLLLETPEANLAQGMRQLNGTYTQYINQKYQRVGHLFQGRYKAILVEKENYLLELSRYISLNPLRANVVEDLKDWPWSSYLQFIGITPKIPCLTTTWILEQFSPDRKKARRFYQEFILSRITSDTPLKEVKGQIFLGSDSFMAKMEELISQQEPSGEIPKKQLYATRPSLNTILQTTDQIDLNIYQANHDYGYTLKEIANHLGLHYTTISKIIKRVESNKEE